MVAGVCFSYVLAFSVHFRTFVFNGICISADVVGIPTTTHPLPHLHVHLSARY